MTRQAVFRLALVDKVGRYDHDICACTNYFDYPIFFLSQPIISVTIIKVMALGVIFDRTCTCQINYCGLCQKSSPCYICLNNKA